uniref:Adaptin ear-binding coat-associated protein 2-like n=1 Tax=Sinocyclocheilus anshuiensis TaxID=1608454 RepID=A0A671LZ22_9TELE
MADSSDQYESVLCVKPEVHVYRIPPRSSNRGYRHEYDRQFRLTASKCVCTLMCVCSGELFAQAPVDQYPGIVVEAVTDSSRYFVIRIEDGNGRHAFIGIGFADRGDSFDFNVALQDHFKWVKQESELARQEAAQVSAPKLDLGFKEGQTIKINIGASHSLMCSTGPLRTRGRDGCSSSEPTTHGRCFLCNHAQLHG